MTAKGADVVGKGSGDFTGGRVWERWVWDIEEERIPDWVNISMVWLEVMGAEGWREGRWVTPVGLWVTGGWSRDSAKEKALETREITVAWGATGMELLEENGGPRGRPVGHVTGSCRSLQERIREVHVRYKWTTEQWLSSSGNHSIPPRSPGCTSDQWCNLWGRGWASVFLKIPRWL